MPFYDVMLLVFGACEVVFAGYLGRILAPQKMQSPESIRRSAVWIGVVAIVLALADYALVLTGHGSPMGWLFAGKH